MEKYIGGICPFCNTEINEKEKVIVCPECGIAHHEECWVQNHGCTTFGCYEQNCYKNEEQEEKVNNIETLKEDNSTNTMDYGSINNNIIDNKTETINRYNEMIIQNNNNFKNKIQELFKNVIRNKILSICIISFIVILGIVVTNVVKTKQAEKAYNEYMELADTYLEAYLNIGVYLEDIADTVQKYWYENIWYDLHGYDINAAIRAALRDCSDIIDTVEINNDRIQNFYNKLKVIPNKISKDDMQEIKKINKIIKEMHVVYMEYYEFAMNPSGSYNSFSEANSKIKKKYIEYFDKLDAII